MIRANTKIPKNVNEKSAKPLKSLEKDSITLLAVIKITTIIINVKSLYSTCIGLAVIISPFLLKKIS